MVELYDWTGEILGAAVNWRWPVKGRPGRLLGLMVPENARYRFLVVASDQEQVRVRWYNPVIQSQMTVAGRILEVSAVERWTGGDVAGPVYWVKEVRIEVTGAVD